MRQRNALQVLRFAQQMGDFIGTHRVVVERNPLTEDARELLLERHLAGRYRQVTGGRQLDEAGVDEHALRRQDALAQLGLGKLTAQVVKLGIGLSLIHI